MKLPSSTIDVFFIEHSPLPKILPGQSSLNAAISRSARHHKVAQIFAFQLSDSVLG